MNLFRLVISKLFLLILFFLFSPGATYIKADTWRGWRGLEKQACCDSAVGPVNWNATHNVLWKVKIDGEGFSSPIVSDSEVYITAARLNQRKMELNALLINLMMILIAASILWHLISRFRLLKKNSHIPGFSPLNELMNFMLYGLLLFAFFTMYWMFFNEYRSQGERILINYLFSGSVLLLSIFLALLSLTDKSKMRMIVPVFTIILIGLLIKYHPITDYYLTPELFKISNLWEFQLIIPCVILPSILSLFLIIKTIILNLKPKLTLKEKVGKSIKLPLHFSSLTVSVAFITGFSGFFAVPVISFLKWAFKSQLTRIQEPLGLHLLITPDFAYPFFLGVISIGFILWFIIEIGKKRQQNEKKNLPLILVLCCSAGLFFIILNYSENKPVYERQIIALDRETGSIKWQKACLIGPAVKCSNYNSQATPTPLTDNEKIYAYFGSAGLVEVNNKGHINWENTELPFNSVHGVGASPVFCKSGIIVLGSMSKDSYLTSLDPKTGHPQWRTNIASFGFIEGEYRTPIIVEYKGVELIIEWSISRNELVVYDAITGAVRCTYNPNWLASGESIATISFKDGVLYLPNTLNIAALDLTKLLSNQNPVKWILDLNGTGPETASPVFSNGLLFMISDGGFCTCIDSDGRKLWQKKLKGTYFSSPVSIGGNIYFSNNSGQTTVIESSPKYRQIAVNCLPEGIYSSAAAVDGKIYIRTKNTLWCLAEKEGIK